MNPWVRRLRGALSLGFLGSFAGAVFGGAWELISTLLGGAPINLEGLVYWTLLGGSVGGASTLGFSVLVSALGSRGTVQGLSIRKAGLWGGVAGALGASLATYSLTGPFLPALQDSLPFVVFCSGVGVAVGGGLVRLAQAAASRELGPANAGQDRIHDCRDEDVG